ncbi:hypothetical protein FACS18948_2090 [Clostridia bacterium]|nr:hypothetical protein FACS18948_2090 [Clostridia bacterium]
MDNMVIDVQSTMVQVIALIVISLIARYVVPWIKARTTAEQQMALNGVLDMLVFAAEQIYGNKTGAEKLSAVLDWAKERGIDAEREDVESAVYRFRASEGVVLEMDSEPEIPSLPLASDSPEPPEMLFA